MALRQAVSRTYKTIALAAGLMVAAMGCASAPEASEPVNVLAPAGAPALATIGLDAQTANVEVVEGQDVLVSELAKTDGSYDMIIAPINLGIKSWSGAQAYELAGVISWGNLYVAAADAEWNTAGNTIALFGENAVPGLVFNALYEDLQAEPVWYPSVAEASQALLSGQADSALLAMPVAQVTVAKSAENGTPVALQDDLQSLWQEKEQSEYKGYPQAALFVKKGEAEKCAAAIESLDQFLDTADDAAIEEALADVDLQAYGIPSADIAVKTWDKQNLMFEPAENAKDEIQAFLDVFGMSLPEDMIADIAE